MAARRVKICGITRAEQAIQIHQLGATALGFICVPETPRYISPEHIRAIATQLPPVCDRVGVFLNAPIETIQQTTAIGHLNCVQLHGSESTQFCDQLRTALPECEIIKALRMRSEGDLTQASLYEPWVDTLLLDAYHPQQAGGTGQTLDWTILKTFHPSCAWFLAGGLTPDNIQTALRLVQPQGIDLSSGVEKAPGDKDLALVSRLFQRLKSLS
jgi:phosphoribosylanthranilate isomerase